MARLNDYLIELKIGKNPEVDAVLIDLKIYFDAQEILSEKFDAVQIKNAQTQLSQIKRQSILLDILKENVDYYEDFTNIGRFLKIVNFLNKIA